LDSSSNNQGAPPPSGANPDGAASPATERFLSCRWRKPADEGVPAHCTHRDVLPMAGTTGFVPESWCPDCAFYKAKRVPKKRQPDEPPSWQRW
jgi:hypothetical protein